MTEPRVSHTRCADSGSDTDATALSRGLPAAGLPGEVGGPPDPRWVAPGGSPVGSRVSVPSVPQPRRRPLGRAGPGGREAPARGPHRKAEVNGRSRRWRAHAPFVLPAAPAQRSRQSPSRRRTFRRRQPPLPAVNRGGGTVVFFKKKEEKIY